MALEIHEIRRPADGAFWRSPERLCVTADGRVTSEDDPEAVSLLVGKGSQLPIAMARRYGLVSEPGETKERKGVEGKPLHKMNKAQLQAIAAEMDLDTEGSNSELVERIATARADADEAARAIEEAATALTGSEASKPAEE